MIKTLLEQTMPGQVAVQLAITPLQLQQKLLNQPPDILFLNEELGGISGFDLLAKSNLGFTPFVLCAQNEALAVQAFKHGALHYIIHPATQTDVACALHKLAKLKTFK